VFPTADEFHDDIDPERNARFRSEFDGIVDFPVGGVEIDLLCVHPRLVGLAAALLRTDDLRMVSAEAWAKYTGAANYDQPAHRDYLNHTPLVPSDDLRFREVEMFAFLSDVTEAHGPPHFVPRPVTGSPAALPNWFGPDERPRFFDEEVSAAGPAGTAGLRDRHVPSGHPAHGTPRRPLHAARERPAGGGGLGGAARLGRPVPPAGAASLRAAGVGPAARAVRDPAARPSLLDGPDVAGHG
jgi:hypothetical protein